MAFQYQIRLLSVHIGSEMSLLLGPLRKELWGNKIPHRHILTHTHSDTHLHMCIHPYLFLYACIFCSMNLYQCSQFQLKILGFIFIFLLFMFINFFLESEKWLLLSFIDLLLCFISGHISLTTQLSNHPRLLPHQACL